MSNDFTAASNELSNPLPASGRRSSVAAVGAIVFAAKAIQGLEASSEKTKLPVATAANRRKSLI